jgi:hypothetical protein
LKLGFVFGVGLMMARPCCPAGQPGLFRQVIRVGLVVFDAVLLFDVVKQKLR